MEVHELLKEIRQFKVADIRIVLEKLKDLSPPAYDTFEKLALKQAEQYKTDETED